MIKPGFLLLIALCSACVSVPDSNPKTSGWKYDDPQPWPEADTGVVSPAIPISPIPGDTINDEYATYYVVVTDTSNDYYFLRQKMMALQKKTSQDIDSMGRYYDQAKHLIVVPKGDDEIYEGQYYPRRYPSENLSLEQLDFYKDGAGQHTMALVTGIYGNEEMADSALALLNRLGIKAFKLKSKIYIGCMH